VLVHWDDMEAYRREFGHIAATWRDLGRAAGTRTVGLRRVQVDPGRWATPLHVHATEEEIFFVLSGSGISLQGGVAYEVGAGDCLVHPAGGPAHTLRAGPDGLDALAFGQRAPAEIVRLPRAGIAWIAGTWIAVGAGEHPYAQEAAAGEPEVPELTQRPRGIVHLDDAEGDEIWRGLGESAGSERTGLNWARLPAGGEGAPPHCHSAEEEIFVVLAGSGTLELTPGPRPLTGADREERHALRAGHVLSRPPGTRLSHCLRAGEDGMTYLAYGTRDPSDVCYYPRSNKFFLRGIGLIGRLEPLDYWDGEPR
jgi:uncharacterized cupin superfamily protein